MKALFFGGGLFPLKTFTKMAQLNYINKLGLVTIENKSKSGERNEIKDFALKNGNIVYEPNLENQQQIDEFVPQLQQYDVGLVCNYKYMIPNQIIQQIPLFVIHPSLLPHYRGASPIQWAILNNEKETGVSYIEISQNKFDAGNIVLQKSIPILDQRYLELSDSLSQLTCDQIDYFLQNYKTLPRKPQGTSPKKAPKKLPIVDLDNLNYPLYDFYRAYYGTRYKSVKLKYMGKEIYIENCQLATEDEKQLLIGQLNDDISLNKKQIYIIKQRPYNKYIYLKQDDQFLRIEQFRYTDQSTKLKGIRLLSTQHYFD